MHIQRTSIHIYVNAIKHQSLKIDIVGETVKHEKTQQADVCVAKKTEFFFIYIEKTTGCKLYKPIYFQLNQFSLSTR